MLKFCTEYNKEYYIGDGMITQLKENENVCEE